MGESAAVPLVEPASGGDDEPFLGLAWAEAIEATELLRSALAALGLAEEIPRLRGDVNVYGRPMVTLGRISPTAARRLAAALSRAAQYQPRVYGQTPAPEDEAGGGTCPLPVPPTPVTQVMAQVALPVAVPMAARVAAPLTMTPVAPPVAPVTPAAPIAPAPRTAGGLPGTPPSDSVRLPA